MNTISIRLPEQLLNEADERAKELRIPRAEYVRKALEYLNKEMGAQRRRVHLMKVSQRVREESMKVSAEFNEVDNDPES
ncbi:MAG: ribbon-helix-helix domain-containing protein [Syntrophus sp. (in: bacteria)]